MCGKLHSRKPSTGIVDSKFKNTSYSVYEKGSATLIRVLNLPVDEKSSQLNENF